MLLLKGVMLIVFGICAATIGGLAVVVASLRKAPEGYEDENGFRIVKRATGAKVTRSPSRRSTGILASLRSARANR
jgi:hypothetical protein